MNIEKAHELKQRPTLLEVESELKTVKKVSWTLSIVLTFFFLAVWPLLALNFGDFSDIAFKFWIIIGQIFIFLSLIYSLFGPLAETYITDFILSRAKKILPNNK